MAGLLRVRGYRSMLPRRCRSIGGEDKCVCVRNDPANDVFKPKFVARTLRNSQQQSTFGSSRYGECEGDFA